MKQKSNTSFIAIIRKFFISIVVILAINTTGISQTWSQIGLDIDGEAADDNSGYSISISADGMTVAIGAHFNDGNGSNAGQIRVYKLISGVWTQQGVDIEGDMPNDQLGFSVSLSADGQTLAAGIPFNDDNGNNAGQVKVYKLISGVWTQQGTNINGELAFDFSGWAVSLSADGLTVAIGAYGNDANGSVSGHVRVYKLISGVWTQQGADIDGEAAFDQSGRSISLSADGLTVAIGAQFNDGNGSNSGHVRVYKLISGVWTQQGADIDGEAIDDESGSAVSLSGDGLTVAIGAAKNDGNGNNAGHVRVYKLISGVWTQQGVDIDSEAGGDNFGFSVSLSNDGLTLAVGAVGNDGNGANSGHVRVYKLISGVWTQQGADIDGEAMTDNSGWAVSLTPDGHTVAIGAIFNDDAGADAGHVRVYSCNSFSSLSVTTCDSYTVPSGNETYTVSGVYMDTIPNSGGCDSIITITLTINNSTTGTDVQTACDSFTWIDGNTYIASNNTATYTLTNASGCDSVVTLNLTINTVSDITTSISGTTITANNTNATYQWLDCDNGNMVISGETSQSYNALANGNYAVQLTENGCVDTSACVMVTGVGIMENDFGDLLRVYPNPSNGIFTLEFDEVSKIQKVAVLNSLGQILATKQINKDKTILEINQPSGIYFIKFEFANNLVIRKIIIE